MEFVSFFVEGLFFKINIFGVLVIMHMKSFHIEMCAQIINTNDVPKVYSSMIVWINVWICKWFYWLDFKNNAGSFLFINKEEVVKFVIYWLIIQMVSIGM
jgi:hypothetical protein